MKYILMMFGPKSDNDVDPSEEYAAWQAWGEEIAKLATKKVESIALQPPSTASVVSVRDGKRITTDGPFIETKEQLGGFYICDCDNLDVALDVAAKMPAALRGHVEIRPITVWG